MPHGMDYKEEIRLSKPRRIITLSLQNSSDRQGNERISRVRWIKAATIQMKLTYEREEMMLKALFSIYIMHFFIVHYQIIHLLTTST